MIGKREIDLMKSGALIVNVSRGAIIDTSAMVDALNSGHLSGAGLDVFEEEPIPTNHPLLDCQHIAVTPHVADMTPEGLDLLNEGVIDNVVAFFEGRPQNVVN
jgi:D-3-phosphoglycerate dehydrogenase